MKINQHLANMGKGYLFVNIAKKVNAYQEQNPEKSIIRLGIGDVTQPLAPHVAKAFGDAAYAMATPEGFHGYGPESGYSFLVDKIIQGDYASRGVTIDRDEVFVSDGSKCDVANIQELFSLEASVAVTDPVYPVYTDTNGMVGRLGKKTETGYEQLMALPCNKENGFVPTLPKTPVDVLYLCYPNNPTGTVLTKQQLQNIVDWANENKVIIVYDAAYKAYITQDDIPRSIYEIKGAKTCAIECCSFSKTAGFTGVRCAYTIVPKELMGEVEGKSVSLNNMWHRRVATKFNGVSYPVQCAAAAVYDDEGQKQVKETIDKYMYNAKLILEGLTKAGFDCYGGVNAPYVWMKTPEGYDSWQFFDALLERCQVVGTPGEGFGTSGEGYFRLTAFNTLENTQKAIERIVNTF